MSRSQGTRSGGDALSLLGLAHRAGAVARGTEATRDAVRRGDARFVIFANDGSKTQLEKILGLLRNRSIHYGTLSDRVGLGAAVGGPPLSAVAVTNPSFAEQLRRRVPSASGGTGRRIENGR